MDETYGALWPSGLPDWAWLLIILGVLAALTLLVKSAGGGRSYGGRGYTYVSTTTSYGSSSGSSSGGSSGGSSGSW